MSVFLKKRPRDVFLRYLELDCGPKVIPQWLWLYSSKRWQSVSWYNLHKEPNGIKDFLVKKQFFLYWMRHRYQSKTCVEHIKQGIDKPYKFFYEFIFFACEGYVFNIEKNIWESQIKKILTFLFQSMYMSSLTITVIGCKNI